MNPEDAAVEIARLQKDVEQHGREIKDMKTTQEKMLETLAKIQETQNRATWLVGGIISAVVLFKDPIMKFISSL